MIKEVLNIIRGYLQPPLSSSERAVIREFIKNTPFEFEGEVDGSVRIKIKGKLYVESEEEVRILSKKDIIISSGQDENKDREGYLHSVWINPVLDKKERPLQLIQAVNTKTDRIEWVTFKMKDNEIELPPGYRIEEDALELPDRNI